MAKWSVWDIHRNIKRFYLRSLGNLRFLPVLFLLHPDDGHKGNQNM
jgi:hypothetical protein